MAAKVTNLRNLKIEKIFMDYAEGKLILGPDRDSTESVPFLGRGKGTVRRPISLERKRSVEHGTSRGTKGRNSLARGKAKRGDFFIQGSKRSLLGGGAEGDLLSL